MLSCACAAAAGAAAGVPDLQFWIRSNTPASAGPFASSTPAGEVPGLKIFLKNVGGSLHGDILQCWCLVQNALAWNQLLDQAHTQCAARYM